MYTCKCGREFKNSQALNGHKNFCKAFRTEEELRLANELLTEKLKLARNRSSEVRQQEKLIKLSEHQQFIEQWISEQHKCEYCGKVMTKYFGSGRFCNQSCSNGWVSFSQSDEAKAKKIEVGKKNLIHDGTIGCCSENYWSDESRKLHSIRMKKVMENPAVRRKISLKLVGRVLSEETKKKISDKVKLSILEGRNKGWTTRRNQESYAEEFWRTVLENNSIDYQQEYVVNKSSLGIDEHGCYFLDFLLPGNVDLEIDGHQHYETRRKQHDKIRDERLANAGYTVYRIKYVNPKNSLVVKEDIDKFLSWYKSLNI